MPKPLAPRRPSQPTGSRTWAALAVCGGLSFITLSAGFYCFALHAQSVDLERILAPAGVALVASALVQGRLIVDGWRNRRLATTENPLAHFSFWRRLAVGAFFAYLAALAIGPLPNAVSAWVAAVAVCYAVLLLPLAVTPNVLEGWRKWSQHRGARRLTWLVYASIALVVCSEGALRLHSFGQRRGWLAARVSTNDNALQFTTAPGEAFRVAIVSNDVELASGEYLARTQEMLPGMELVPLVLDDKKAPAQSLSARLVECRPDLVVAPLAACSELARKTAEPSWFDWRQFELARRLVAPAERVDTLATASSDPFETFLHELSPQLAACRTPLDETMRTRWQRTFAELDTLSSACRQQDVPLAIVLVPSHVQVNRALSDTLARRAGARPEQFDLDLPQRRLFDYAQQHKVPVLDLLPHLRLSGQALYQRNANAWNDEGQAVAAGAISSWLESGYGREPALTARLSRLK
jgi:broad specificity phosphatase PhoE